MSTDESRIDIELMQQIKTGDNRAFDDLFKRYYSYLCSVVYRMNQSKELAEDVVQEVYLDLWRKREQIEIKSAVKAYLHRAVMNKTLNKIRAQKIKFEATDEKLARVSTDEVSALQEMQGKELEAKLKTAFEGLPERCRIVFSMVKYEGMSYKETAQKLEISVKTVENQISKALKIMRKAIYEYKNE